MAKINKDQLIERISKSANVPRKETADVLQALEDEVTKIMREGNEAVLTGFGSFLARTRAARVGVNPQRPSERIQVPAVRVPKFKAGKTLKDALKSPTQ